VQKVFETIVDSYLLNKVGVADHFLNPVLSAHLKNNLLQLHQQDNMHYAGTGNLKKVQLNAKMRGDQIYWLDRSHDDRYENEFFDVMDDFIQYLNSSCYAGISAYEFHYTLYEKGSFYRKHYDQFQSDNSRAYSMIMYLNENWQIADGGELCIHHAAYQQHISPDSGKSVFFKSDELEHEVLLTNKSRMSITGWLKVG
jgi:SM-20-related protein